jgi:CheY-like chemotaxis protein
MAEYQNLIKEAFIDPIRSVLIVDDQYPTWAEVLNELLPDKSRDVELNERSAKKNWRDEPTDTLSVITQFRKQKPALIIDIHDASDIYSLEEDDHRDMEAPGTEKASPEQTGNHLHQSDLLILDYNLEGATSGLEGLLARRILKSVLSNSHFNLVIVHTQEKDLKKVFYDCLVSLSTPLHPSFEKRKRLIDTVRKRLEELSDEEEFNRRELVDYLDLDAYMKLRHRSTGCDAGLRLYMKGEGPLSALHEWAKKLGLENGHKMGFAYWAIREFETERADIFSDEVFDGLSWTEQDDRLWLRTGRGFVTFVKKDHQDLLSELQLSLQAWQPSPSRLLSAKVRHEISCNGVEAEDRTLSKAHVFAYFYDLIRNGGTEEKRAALIREHLSRQTEALTSQIEPAVVQFGKSIFDTDSRTGETFASHYGVDLSNDGARRLAATHFNSYVSTLPLGGGDQHLDCGHIFCINSEWWVCATPACDMEPGQNTIAFLGDSKELRPFTALRLEELKGEALTDKHVNSGLYCFAETEPGKIRCLGLPSTTVLSNATTAQPGTDKVTWRTFIAKKDGLFTDNKFELIMPRLNADKLEPVEGSARIVAKLRYEYALNYIQKVGASVTRIGLGYRGGAFG